MSDRSCILTKGPESVIPKTEVVLLCCYLSVSCVIIVIFCCTSILLLFDNPLELKYPVRRAAVRSKLSLK